MLFLSQIIIYAPVLFTFLQNFVQWGFLSGFLLLCIGFTRFKRSNQEIIDIPISPGNFNSIIQSSGLLVICTICLSLLPPVSLTISDDKFTIYSIFLSIFWMLFYMILLFWIIGYWNFINDPLALDSLSKNKIRWVHLLFVAFISAFWFLQSFSLIFLSLDLFSNTFIVGVYVILFLLFMLFQIWFYYKLRTFTFRIIG